MSAAPQSAQNFALGTFSEPHLEHLFGKELPHSAQNLFPTPPSVPHFEQRMAPGHLLEQCALVPLVTTKKRI